MFSTYRDPRLNSVLHLTDEVGFPPGIKAGDTESFFTIIWNRDEPMCLGINDWETELEKNQLICLTPLQRSMVPSDAGMHYRLMFNRQFYCIHENDHEVSCEGLLFWGSSKLPVITLDAKEQSQFKSLFEVFIDELQTRDRIQGEMLRMLLKRLIIKSTRIARDQHFPDEVKNEQVELIRKFNILVEQHFRDYHQVSTYAEMLHKSPKTLSNVFAEVNHKTPLEVIHSRIALEAKHLLLKTDKTAKEIAYGLGFDEAAHFSRFFKKETGFSPSAFRKENEQ